MRGAHHITGWLTAAALALATVAVTTPAVADDDPVTAAYVPAGPLRLADTRAADCTCQHVAGDTVRVVVDGRPGVPGGAVAAAITVTALPTAQAGFVTAYPGGTARPPTSTVNTSPGRAVANSAIIPLGADGSLDVFAYPLDGGAPADVIVDLTGVFVEADTARSGRFVALAPGRLADTRDTGALPPGGELTVGLPAGVPADATALALNVTSVDEPGPGFLSGRPAGTPLAANPTSFLNTGGAGHPIAAAVVLPVSAGGFTLYSYGGGHVIVDVTGWFTGDSAGESDAGLFVPLPPHRLRDTRTAGPRAWTGGTIEVPSPVLGAALVTNVTVTRPDWRGFVTAYPAGTPRPATSAVNAATHGHTVANLAITPVSDRGLAYYALAGTDLAVDVTGYFTGPPAPATEPPAGNVATTPRLLIVGDSAMAALDDVYTDAKAALAWADVYYDADNCRRLVHTSCRSPVTGRIPSTALEAIWAAPGQFDVVYIDVGHNDWLDNDFEWQFDTIVQAARAKGAKLVLWATYTENVHGAEQQKAYRWNNEMLRWITTYRSQYPDVLLADWNAYSWNHPEWFWDGTHMYRSGAWGTADYLSRWLAAIAHLPCPAPLWPGGPIDDPCPAPDLTGPPADVRSLYP